MVNLQTKLRKSYPLIFWRGSKMNSPSYICGSISEIFKTVLMNKNNIAETI